MKTNNKKGMTLFELLIVIIVISIIAVMSFASFDSMAGSQHTETAKDQLAYAIKKAKYYARKSGTKTTINIPTNSQTYSIVSDGNTITNSAYFDATSGQLPGGVKIISNTCPALNFKSNGSLVDNSDSPISADCTIIVGLQGSTTKTLKIQPGTGNVIYE